MMNESELKNVITEIIEKILKENNEMGVTLRALLDGEIAMALKSGDLSDYGVRNQLIDKIESRIAESD